jgi:hypothetical protein
MSLVSITCFLGGSSQWTFHNIAVTVIGLGRKNINPNLHDYRKSGIFYMGNVLSKIWLGGVGLILLGEGVIFVAPIEGNNDFYFHFIIAILSVGAIAWFFIIQIKIHKLMSEEKKERLSKICSHIDEITKNPKDEFSKNREEVEKIMPVYNHVKSLPEWPFDTRTVFRVLTAGLIPIITSILNMIL